MKHCIPQFLQSFLFNFLQQLWKRKDSHLFCGYLQLFHNHDSGNNFFIFLICVAFYPSLTPYFKLAGNNFCSFLLFVLPITLLRFPHRQQFLLFSLFVLPLHISMYSKIQFIRSYLQHFFRKPEPLLSSLSSRFSSGKWGFNVKKKVQWTFFS